MLDLTENIWHEVKIYGPSKQGPHVMTEGQKQFPVQTNMTLSVTEAWLDHCVVFSGKTQNSTNTNLYFYSYCSLLIPAN